MSIHQAYPVFELMLDTVDQVTEVLADIASHRELLVVVKNMRAVISLPEFVTHNSTCNCLSEFATHNSNATA